MNKDNNNIVDSILNTIEKTGKKPHSKIYFEFKNIFVWFLASSTAIIGSLFVSSIIFRIINLRRILPPFMARSTGPMNQFFIKDFPIFLFLFFIVLVFLLYKEIRMTRSGYKYEMPIIFLAIGFISCVLGIVWYVLGLGYHVDRIAVRNVPNYYDIEHIQSKRWFSPEQGALTGKVIEINKENILVKDPEGNVWNVFLNKGEDEIEVFLILGQRVGVMGEKDTDEFVFNACDIKSLEFEHAGNKNINERKITSVRINKCGERTTSQLIN